MLETGFLAEVLATKEETLIVDIKQKIPIITSQIEKLKYEIKTYTENGNNFPAPRNVNNKLLKQADAMNIEMDQLMEKINEVTKKEIDKSILDVESLTLDLKETIFSLKLATQLVNINEALKKIDNLKKEKKFVEAAEEISIARKIINEIPIDEHLDIFKTVKVNLTIEREELLEEIINLWREAVVIELVDIDDITNILIKIDNNSYDLQQIMKALYFEKNTMLFNDVSNCILNNILIPLINNTIQIKIYEKNNFEILDVKIKKKSPKMDYRTVFDNLRTVFDYFCCKINYILEPNLSFLRYIGNKTRKEFCECFIENCLADMVPSTKEGLAKFKEVVKEIESLQLSLSDCDFFDEECSQILEYAGNVDVLFANKICKNYLDQSLQIMKKDLHDMIEVGKDPNQGDENKKINNFPICYVSRSACEILDLSRTILDQAANSTDMCAGRLLYTSKQIFDLYCTSIPEFHKKLLETIPQQVALFHNNCMYLSHNLMFNKNLNIKMLSKNVITGETFDYQIKNLRTAGTDAFLKYMRLQVKQIEDILNDSELAMLSHLDKLDTNCEKSVRQCLRQLEILKTVWQKVLTYEIYNKTIGELLNSFVNHLIKLVLTVEDISADTSKLLVEIFNIVQTRGPKLFTEPKEINMYTKQWCKFNELILLLNSNLSDINDRWADGKGPLAVEYRPEDIKRLIRALFQNTDRRAAVLGKIN